MFKKLFFKLRHQGEMNMSNAAQKTLENQKGFSLVELMIVVAIIGLLAAIGIPQYTKFQARARTSEAKAALGGLYTAEASFFQEWNCYVSDLRNIGFGVTGANLRYVTGFDTAITANPGGCNTGAPPHGGADYNLTDGNGTAGVLASISPGATWAITPANSRTAVAANDVTPTATVFTAASAGDPKNTITNPASTAQDVWTIDQNKSLSSVIVGF